MQQPIQIAFRNVDASDAVEAHIRSKIDWLETFHDRIQSCRVVVEVPHRHHRHGKIYQVRIDVTLPGAEFVVNREPAMNGAHEDVYVAIRDAFDAARRRVEDIARRRGETRPNERARRARVVRFFPEEGYGYLETSDGREIYFHRNSVLQDRFGDARPGAEVSFAEEEGERGPQASTVRVVGRAHTR